MRAWGGRLRRSNKGGDAASSQEGWASGDYADVLIIRASPDTCPTLIWCGASEEHRARCRVDAFSSIGATTIRAHTQTSTKGGCSL